MSRSRVEGIYNRGKKVTMREIGQTHILKSQLSKKEKEIKRLEKEIITKINKIIDEYHQHKISDSE